MALTAATTSLRSIPVHRPRSAWLDGPYSSRAASIAKWYRREPVSARAWSVSRLAVMATWLMTQLGRARRRAAEVPVLSIPQANRLLARPSIGAIVGVTIVGIANELSK